MTRSLVTGGTGFIGRHLVKQLTKKGHKVDTISREMSIDITSINSLKKYLKNKNYDYIFHFAAAPAQTDHLDSIEFKTNVIGTYNLLRIFRDRKFKGFINAGTSLEYDISNGKVKENMAPVPTLLHGGTKAAATMIATAFAYEFNLPIITVRPFSVYGPNEKRPRLVPVVIRAALSGEPLKIYPGVHDWIYIDDFVKATYQLAKKAKRLKGQIFNVGTGIETDNAALVSYVEKIMDTKIKKINVGKKYRPYDNTSHWVADITKLKSIIKWEPISLEEGLRKTIESFSQTDF